MSKIDPKAIKASFGNAQLPGGFEIIMASHLRALEQHCYMEAAHIVETRSDLDREGLATLFKRKGTS